MLMKKKVYVVWKGVKPGVYDTWEECKQQIDGFADAKYMRFESYEKAVQAFNEPYYNYINQKNTSQQSFHSDMQSIVFDSISVDAACSVGIGVMEYRGVHTKTKKVLFHKGPFGGASNNIGEFLAIVHAMAYMQKNGLNYPIYTDSHTAVTWVKKKEIRTKIETSPQIADMLERALIWLKDNKPEYIILKWRTDLWGEIYADFGRK